MSHGGGRRAAIIPLTSHSPSPSTQFVSLEGIINYAQRGDRTQNRADTVHQGLARELWIETN